MRVRLADDFLDHFVATVLGHVDREYPNKLDHVMNGPADVRSPCELHPIFYGSFDWHSCVHGHWLLARALRMFPALAQADEIRALFNARFTPENVRIETQYLGQPTRGTFERTYGWAWLLKLSAELLLASREGRDPHFAQWHAVLAPLTDAFVDRYTKYLPKATYPIRVGTHTNTAFGLALAIDYAQAAANAPLLTLLTQKARAWYERDANYPAWEPDGTDFLSPGLMEAECMRRVLPPDRFLPWFDHFLPNLAQGEPAALFTPAFVSDRSDGQITHLDGLNLSRAWCWRALAQSLPAHDPRRARFEAAFTTHLDAALPHVTGDYMGEHWLATFALLALTE